MATTPPRKPDVTAIAELIGRSQPRPTSRPAPVDEDELDPPDAQATNYDQD